MNTNVDIVQTNAKFHDDCHFLSLNRNNGNQTLSENHPKEKANTIRHNTSLTTPNHMSFNQNYFDMCNIPNSRTRTLGFLFGFVRLTLPFLPISKRKQNDDE